MFLLFFAASYGQESMQDSYVTKAYANVDENWSEVSFVSQINVSSNREGLLKITNYEFLNELSNGKAKMAEKSGYNSAEFTSQKLTKEKVDKKGVRNLTFEGVLAFKTYDGIYSAPSRIIFLINQADIIGLKILNMDNSKEYAFNLQPQ